jgi:hypothetical protein
MWAPVRRNRRAVSPPYYPTYDALDLYRPYNYDAITPAYYNGYGLGAYGLGLGDFVPSGTNPVEHATRMHAGAQGEMEKAQEKFEEAKKKLEECEKKVKQAEEMLRVAKIQAAYAV